MPNQILPVTGLDTVGVNKDTPPAALPAAAFSDVRNVRFRDGAVLKMEGEVNLFPEVLVDSNNVIDSDGLLKYVAWWPNPNLANQYTGYYLIIVQRADTDDPDLRQRDHVYIALPDGRASLKGKYQPDSMSNWQHTFFQGGFCVVINNGQDVPAYILDVDGNTNIDDVPNFKTLPGWQSYQVNQELLNDTFTDGDSRIFDLGQSVDFEINQVIVATDTELVAIAGDPAGSGTPNDTDFVPGIFDLDTVAFPDTGYTIYQDTETGTTILVFSEADIVLNSNVRVTIRSRDPVNVRCGVIRSFGDFLVCANLIEVSAVDPDVIIRNLPGVVRSSDVAVPGSIPNNWNPFASGASTADEFVVTQEGIVQDLVELQGSLYIYSNSSISAMSRTGNAAVPLTINSVTDSYGVQTTDAVIQFDGQHFIVGSQDVYIFGGHPGNIQSVADGRVRDYLFKRLNPLHEQRMFVIRNRQRDEIWICYPTGSSRLGECDEALIWNYRKNNWTIRDLYNVTAGNVGPVPGGGVPVGRITLDGITGDNGVTNIGAFEIQRIGIDDVDTLPADDLVGIQSRYTITVSDAVPLYTTTGQPIFSITLGDGFNTGSGEDTVRFFSQGRNDDTNEVFALEFALAAGLTTKAGLITDLVNNDDFNTRFNIQDNGNVDDQFFIEFVDTDVVSGSISLGSQQVYAKEDLIRDTDNDIVNPENQLELDTDGYTEIVSSVIVEPENVNHRYFLNVIGDGPVPDGVVFRLLQTPGEDQNMYVDGNLTPMYTDGDTEFFYQARLDDAVSSEIVEPWVPTQSGFHYLSVLVPDTDTFTWTNMEWSLQAYNNPSNFHNGNVENTEIGASLRDFHGDDTETPPVLRLEMGKYVYNAVNDRFEKGPDTKIGVALGGSFSDTEEHNHLLAEHISVYLHDHPESLFDTVIDASDDTEVVLTSIAFAQHYLNVLAVDDPEEIGILPQHFVVDTEQLGKWPYTSNPNLVTDDILAAVYPSILMTITMDSDSDFNDIGYDKPISITNPTPGSILTTEEITSQIVANMEASTNDRWSSAPFDSDTTSLPKGYVQLVGSEKIVAATTPRPVTGLWDFTVTSSGNIQYDWLPSFITTTTDFEGKYERYATPSYIGILLRNTEAINGLEVIILRSNDSEGDYNAANHSGSNGSGASSNEVKNYWIERIREANRRLNVFDRGDSSFIIQPSNYNDSANFILEVVLNDSEGIDRLRQFANGMKGDTEISINPLSDTPFINVFDNELQIASNAPKVAGSNDSQLAPDAGRLPSRITTETDATLDNIATSQPDDNVFDINRPWPSDEVNFNLQFPIFAGNTIEGADYNINKITGADIGYSRPAYSLNERMETFPGNRRVITGNDSEVAIRSYVYRSQLPLTPEFTTETLGSVSLWADGSYKPGFFDSEIFNRLTIETFGTDNPGAVKSADNKQADNLFFISQDYKVDLRTHGRFINIYIGDQESIDNPNKIETTMTKDGTDFNQSSEWRLSGLQLEIMEGGRR